MRTSLSAFAHLCVVLMFLFLLGFLFPVAERPQHMLMRVAVGIHKNDIDAAIETYNLLSERWFTHASPTLFNAGTNRPQLSRYLHLLSWLSAELTGIKSWRWGLFQ